MTIQSPPERYREWFFYGDKCPFDRGRFPGEMAAPGLIEEAYRLQYRAFVEKEGWILPEADHQRRLDIDHFDRFAWKGLLTDSTGRLVACYRLMPTDGLNMLHSEFPKLMQAVDKATLNKYFNAQTAEISRVALCPEYLEEPSDPKLIRQRTRHLFSIVAFCSLRSARLLGKTHLLAVIEPKLDRYLSSSTSVGLSITHLNPQPVWVGYANETERVRRRIKRKRLSAETKALEESSKDQSPLVDVEAFLNVIPTDLKQHPALHKYLSGLQEWPELDTHTSIWEHREQSHKQPISPRTPTRAA